MTATLRMTRPTRSLRRSSMARAGALAVTAALALTACSSGADEATAGASESAMASEDAMEDTEAMEDKDAAMEDKDGESMEDGDHSESMDGDATEMTDSPLDFTAATVSGGELDLATLAGEPVVLWFWAPWCTVCRGEAPDVSEVAGELDDVTFIGVAGRGEVDAMQGFVSDTKVTGFEHLADEDGSIWSRFGVASQPSFAFVSPDGSVETVVGALGADALRDRASALLGG